MAVENEYKFTSDRTDADQCLSKLESFVNGAGICYSVSRKSYVDRYYDSDSKEITVTGCFIRQRTYSDGKCKLTVKRPVSADGVISREEIERTSDGSLIDLQDFCNECFPKVLLNDEPMLVNECERTVFSFTDGLETKLSFDVCQYVYGDRRRRYLEIEFEVISDSVVSNFDDIGLRGFVMEKLDFRPVTESKYTRGLRWKDELKY